jgi:hypothetical protein
MSKAMSKAISVSTLNRFVAYPYLVLGWGKLQGVSYPNRVRQYSVYKMISPSLVELLPLPPSLIEDVIMPSGISTRLIYNLCTGSMEWQSPFLKGCLKSMREVIQALESLGLLLPEYWQTSSEGGKAKNISLEMLRESSACAYNLVIEAGNFQIKRGKKIMATKNGVIALVEEVDEDVKPRRKSGISLMNECYVELTRGERVTAYGLKLIYDYLSRTLGSVSTGIDLLARFDAHINSSSRHYEGIPEKVTISEFMSFMRQWGVPAPAIELSTSKILEESQNSFDLEGALEEIQQISTAKNKK